MTDSEAVALHGGAREKGNTPSTSKDADLVQGLLEEAGMRLD